MAPLRRAVLWFRNDLRLQDNQLFHYQQVRQAEQLLPVYCVDPRHFEQSPWSDNSRTGALRARFLAESLENLDQSLRGIGSRLLVVAGRPEDAIPSLMSVGAGSSNVLAFQREDTWEEQQVEGALLRALPKDAKVLCHFGHTLFHREDLGWDPTETLPLPFGKFFHDTCKRISPRKELLAPLEGQLPPPPPDKEMSSAKGDWSCLAVDAEVLERWMAGCASASGVGASYADRRASCGGDPAIEWIGGEASGMRRLIEYAVPGGLGTYHRTRNQLHGANHSSHLSPWLANGCLSPRTVYWRAKVYESSQEGSSTKKQPGNFDHVGKFVFELCWRDYFRFYCARFGARIFFSGGPAGRMRPWRRNAEAETRWREGRTGAPLVDALMRELRATGYIANRGRYVVASYLVHYLGIDWRVGADWFETHLLDHDVCSNYGEWTSMAGVAAAPSVSGPLGLKGRGPTGGRRPGARGQGGDPWAKGATNGAANRGGVGDAIFDPWEQAAQYDPSETYVRLWVPELRRLPAGHAHWPFDLDLAARKRAGCVDYPDAPLAAAPTFTSDGGGADKCEETRRCDDNRACSRELRNRAPLAMESAVTESPSGWGRSKRSRGSGGSEIGCGDSYCSNPDFTGSHRVVLLEAGSAARADGGRRWRSSVSAVAQEASASASGNENTSGNRVSGARRWKAKTASADRPHCSSGRTYSYY
eukprot:TRINITY_DN67827_c0_g1_i1.p1 TRINITY_DN67827_c0_g1~~TRINITY_DN67827_c0_g1_i1.p1  ORF type:complete len:702 (-),score=91.66 TRINITY_DN67827_c0_g1_i1:67-2172(-)